MEPRVIPLGKQDLTHVGKAAIRPDAVAKAIGPTLGAEWPGLHALFAAMPAEQHAPAMLALRAASPQARADLAVLAQRTPPQERDALRAQWLAVAPDARDAWLRARVDP